MTGKLQEHRVEALLARTRREVDDGVLPAAQLAVGLDGEIVFEAAFGGADTDTRFVAYSCTKAIVAAAVWRLVGQGAIDVGRRVADYVPEFAANGKDVVTVEQVMLHTGGFPWAPLGPPAWETPAGRRAAFARWRLTLDPGEQFMYHPTAGHWVLAEIIETVTGEPYPDAVERLVTAPLGLPRLLAIPVDHQDGIAPVSAVGEAPTAAEMEAVFGFAVDLSQVVGPDVATAALVQINEPAAMAVGIPGGGGIMRARDLAAFYQALLHDPLGLWDPEVLADATGHVRNRLADWTGIPANRSLGLVIAGDDDQAAGRGMGRTVSPGAFGHNGAGGQVAWADPDSGLSFTWFTNGLDQNIIRERRRVTAVASLAGDLLRP